MFGNRKRFLRKESAVINLDYVQMIKYEPEEEKIFFWFGENDHFFMDNKTPADFEKIVRALKYGRAGK